MVKSNKKSNSLKKRKTTRYNKKGGGFFGGDDTPVVAAVNETETDTKPALDAPAAPAQGMGENKDKECCPCNKGIGDMLNPKDALNKLEQNIIGAQQNAVNTVTQKVTDSTNEVKEKGRGFFSKLFGGPKSGEPISGGGRKSKRRTSRKSKGTRRTSKRRSSMKGKRKGKGKGKRITRRK
jgi:hypothetical protein